MMDAATLLRVRSRNCAAGTTERAWLNGARAAQWKQDGPGASAGRPARAETAMVRLAHPRADPRDPRVHRILPRGHLPAVLSANAKPRSAAAGSFSSRQTA